VPEHERQLGPVQGLAEAQGDRDGPVRAREVTLIGTKQRLLWWLWNRAGQRADRHGAGRLCPRELRVRGGEPVTGIGNEPREREHGVRRGGERDEVAEIAGRPGPDPLPRTIRGALHRELAC
jgi:hypothetical protein